MEERLLMLLRELEAEKGGEREKGIKEILEAPKELSLKFLVFDLEGLQDSFELVYKVGEILSRLETIRGGEGYTYHIYGSRSTIILDWWGDQSRLPEVKKVIERIVQSIRDNLWEDYMHIKVLAELKASRKEWEELYRPQIEAIYEAYHRRPPREVLYDAETDSFIVKVTAGSEGWYIGRQGSVIRPLEERVGKRIHIVGV